jgi:hypothetical protein
MMIIDMTAQFAAIARGMEILLAAAALALAADAGFARRGRILLERIRVIRRLRRGDAVGAAA